MPRTALELVANRNWLITGDALETVMSVAEREGDVQALEARLGRPLDNARNVTVRDGVAVVPVTGPIFRYANLFTEISGAVSTEALATDIQRALDDPSVNAIVINADSPGGEATGINELGDLIYNARARKRIVTYVGGMAASAMYWIGSAAGEVVIDDTAQLGSVGVVMSLHQRAEREGSRSWEIVSTNAPNKRPDPNTEAGRAQLQSRVDELASVFLDKVARNRGIPRDQVNDRFRQGGMATGSLAVEAGMADRLGSLETLIAELAGTASPASAPQRRRTMTIVRTTAELHAAIDAGTDPKQIAIAEPEKTDTEAQQKTAADKATAAERERCKGITALSAPGFEKEIAAALEDGASVEAAGYKLFKAAQDRGISLDTIKGDATEAAATCPPDGDTAATDRQAGVSAITRRWAKQ